MKFPSKTDFTEGFRKFEKTLWDKKEDLSKGIEELGDDHPLYDQIIKTAIPFLPPPFNGIAQALYDNFRGPKKDKVDQLVSDLAKIANQTDEQYTRMTSKLDYLLAEVSDIRTVVAKEETLLVIKEILTSNAILTNEKMEKLREEIILMRYSFGESLEEIRGLSSANFVALARILHKLNDPVLLEQLAGNPYNPGIKAERDGDKIFFRHIRSNLRSPVAISHEEFQNLEPRQLKLLRAYEYSMERKFDEWSSKKSGQDIGTSLEDHRIRNE